MRKMEKNSRKNNFIGQALYFFFAHIMKIEKLEVPICCQHFVLQEFVDLLNF